MALSHSQLEELWLVSGGSAASADMAAAIAQAESGGCQYAKAGPNDDRPVEECTYRRTDGENSYGLWQINRRAHPQYSAASLYTTTGNAKAAVAIASGGASFSAWSTYTNGAYKLYLHAPVTSTTGKSDLPESTTAGVPPVSLHGFHETQHAIATSLPTALRRATALRRDALRRLK